MKTYVVLENSLRCELDRVRVWINNPQGEEDNTSQAIHDAIAEWTLDVGDVIRIVEED